MIEIKKHAGIYTLKASQFIPWPIEKVWNFFSQPKNLGEITPEHMGFKITSSDFRTAFPGQIITYKIGIIPGIKSNWVTEITQVKKHQYFIDEQRFGPYKMWHHEHSFEETEGGVLCYDIVNYKVPFKFLGHLIHQIFIKNQLQKILIHRKFAIDKLSNNNK